MKPFPLLVMAVTATLFAAGCGTPTRGVRMYGGETRPTGQVAQLVASSEFDVKSISGARSDWPGVLTTGREMIYEMLPGQYEVVARFYDPLEHGATVSGSDFDRPDQSGFQTIRFRPAPGRRYAITRETINGEVRLFIEDRGLAMPLGNSAAAMQVAGESGANPEPDGPAPLKTAGPPSVTVATELVKEEPVEAPLATPLDHLKRWWLYATPQERSQFRQWIDSGK